MNKVPKVKENNFLFDLSELLCNDLCESGRIFRFDSRNRKVKERAGDLMYNTIRKRNKVKMDFADLRESLMVVGRKENNGEMHFAIAIKLLIDELVPSLSNKNNI